MPIPENKLCRRCGTTKHNSEFYRRRKGSDLVAYCKPCMNNQAVERQRHLKQEAIDYKGGSCERCGYNKCPAALEFHHTDPTQKDFSISHTKNANLNDTIRLELDKCIVLCANCHREEHWSGKLDTINLTHLYKKPKVIKRCVGCDVVVDYKATRCAPCHSKAREKIMWPDTAELVKMVENTNYSAVGRALGVSNIAVRKRIKNH
jgi:hypothetical protein